MGEPQQNSPGLSDPVMTRDGWHAKPDNVVSMGAGSLVDIFAAARAAKGDPLKCAKFDRNDKGNAARLISHFGDQLIYVTGIGWYSWDGRRWDGENGPVAAEKFAQLIPQAIKLEAAALEGLVVSDLKAIIREKGEGLWKLSAGVISECLEALESVDTVKDLYKVVADKLFSFWAAGGAATTDKFVTGKFEAAGFFIAARMDAIQKHYGWAITSGNSGRLSAMLDVAEAHLTKRVDELDADDWLFNVDNGTLVLDRLTGQVTKKRHDPKDLITMVSPIAFDPDARSMPLFDAYINRCQPERALQGFLAEYAGYTLTGDTGEQVLVMFDGGGSDGKSTFAELQRHVMGDYSANTQFETLTPDSKRSGSGPTPDLARLVGKRGVFAEEPEQGTKLAEGLVKQLTGGTSITVRNLQQPPFEYRPKFKLTLSFNNKPRIQGQDNGIWRRVILVPWKASIPKSEVDKRLVKKILQAEGSQLLNWILDGFTRWAKRGGFDEPQTVIDAGLEYRGEMDPMGRWVDTAIEKALGFETTAKSIYAAYQAWCNDNAQSPLTQTLFGTMMAKKGFHKKKNARGNMVYLDIRIATGFDAMDYQTPVKGGGGDDDETIKPL